MNVWLWLVSGVVLIVILVPIITRLFFHKKQNYAKEIEEKMKYMTKSELVRVLSRLGSKLSGDEHPLTKRYRSMTKANSKHALKSAIRYMIIQIGKNGIK
jgi:hypothetical protein